MASGQNDIYLRIRPPQHAGVKGTRAQEREPRRKSARLEKLRQDKPTSVGSYRERTCDGSGSGVRGGEECTQQRHKPVSRKRLRTQNDQAAPEGLADNDRKQQREPVQQSTSAPPPPGNLIKDEQHPISYWVVNRQWPRQYFEKCKDMEKILAQKRSESARSRKNSDTDSATPNSTDQGEPKSREQKSAEYKKPQYETVLATKGVLMEPSPKGANNSSREWCKDLLEGGQEFPEDTLFRDDLFDTTCKTIRNRNETRVIRDIALLIVPSAEIFATRGTTDLQCLIESVNEGWNNSIPITKARPQPDYAVGFRREAFTQEQLDRMHPVVGDFNDQSYFMATWYMYFPFLTCEVKCGAVALGIADRQNAHSMALAVRAVVELFRTVKREKELHQEILGFSISHDHRSVRIYGYYAEINDLETKYYRYPIHTFDFTALDGKEKWTAYKFTKNVYDNWMPMHLKRICSAIDEIPAAISFSVSQSELRFSEQPSGLSQDFSTYGIAQSSVGSTSEHPQDDTQSSISQDPVVTPSTSVHEGAPFKIPRQEFARRGRK